MIEVITVGKKHEAWVADGIERYQRRLKKPWGIKWSLLPHSSQTGDAARKEESQRIYSRLRPDHHVILLDETGQNIASTELASRLQAAHTHSRQLVVIIGGAYGVDQTIVDRADFIWSLSRLVFPHQLVRLILAEQLYRAQEIALGNPYHHS